MTGFAARTAMRGFTLLELVLTIAVLGALTLILIPFYQAISHSADPMLRQQAVGLGQAMMDEILAKKWDAATPSGGGPLNTLESSRGAAPASSIGADAGEVAANRHTWDDVDDFSGLSETNTFTDQNNTSFTLSGFSRQVTVTYIPSNSNPITATAPAGFSAAAQATDSKRIVVRVTAPNQEVFSLVAVVCNF